MAKVPTKTIANLRDSIYNITESDGVTAITRGGRFVGVLISTGELSEFASKRLHQSIRHNPHHAIQILARKALG